ncbi:MAG: cellobiose phosphorylase, partial [Elusimicrobia bacterium]|nr:cellobiose phosphorylase [Elusimicrobiota bacterium]
FKYYLNQDGSFVIENYNLAPTFSSFFPGISGVKGIPMWAYYVNRGQGICTFGIKNKNYAIMEFYPANVSYNLVNTFGFRTFLKIKKGKETICYEPFKNNSADIKDVKQNMYVSAYDLTIEEINTKIGIKTTVTYFTLPNQPLAGLLRKVTVENISKQNVQIEIVDGMPKILPYYINSWSQKYMSTTIQAWTKVDNFDKTGVPFYKLKVETADSSEVVEITEGNFYCSLVQDKKVKKADIIIDPDILFGSDTSFACPEKLFNENFVYPKKQFADNKYPTAFSYAKQNLKSKESFKIYSIVGHIESAKSLNSFVKKFDIKYFEAKQEENKNLINSITSNMETHSSIPEFDMYCRQNYLDNVMRGGLPIEFKYNDKSAMYYVFSRKHGDLERDYNEFQVSPNYYSQGNGNYRDVNQNRRKDIFFNPNVKDSAVKIFYNLLQIDACNPLVVKGTLFVLDTKSKEYKNIISDLSNKKDEEKLNKFFQKPFEPGSLATFMEFSNIKTKIKFEDFISKVVTTAKAQNDANHGEGYWVDHWKYNFDILESFLTIYPDKKKDIFFNDKSFIYYDNDHYVLPR